MVCTKLDAGICKVIAAPCPKRYEVKMVTFKKCSNFGKAPVKLKMKIKMSKGKKTGKSHSKRRR